ncbi:MAG: response regulator [Caulobacteraceae bacterium]
MSAAIQRIRPGIVVEEVGSFEGVQRSLARDPNVELLLLDLKLPDNDGFAGLMFLRAEFAQVPVVMVSATEDAATISDALAMGAQGFVPKSASLREMAEALSAVLAGDIWTPDRLALSEPSPHVRMLASLSPAQVRVLSGLRRGPVE